MNYRIDNLEWVTQRENILHARRTGLYGRPSPIFHRKLNELQQKRNESNQRLAKSIGVSASSVANWKSGEITPRPRHVKMLAEHFGVTVDELLRSEQEPV